MLEGSVLVHLLNSIVIQTFCLCDLDLSWTYLESSLGSHTHYKVSARYRVIQAKAVSHDGWLAISAVSKVFPLPKGSLCYAAISSKGGVDEAVFPGALSFLRTLAGTGKPLFNLYVPSFLWTGPVMEFFGLWVFLFTHQGFSHLSVVPCHSFHPGGVLICQRIHTSIKLRSKWPGPIIQEVLLVLLPTVGLRRKHLGLPK